MISRILAATDLSVRGDRALARAMRLRRKFDAQLTVLHVVEDELPEPIAKRRAEEARALTQAQVRALGSGADLDATLVEVGFGINYDTIIRRAGELDAGLTVLGTHRESPWRDLFLGGAMCFPPGARGRVPFGPQLPLALPALPLRRYPSGGAGGAHAGHGSRN